MAKYTYIGNGIIWDAEANKPLAKFGKDGLFETEDGKTAGKLKKLGYEPAEVIKEKQEGNQSGGQGEGTGDPNGGGGDGNNNAS